jgi:hypothetical protein
MDLTSTSMAAAASLNQTYAALGNAIAAVGQNPSAGTVVAQSQAATQTQIGMSVLKQSLSIQADTGAQLSQMISQGSRVDIQA